MPTYTGASFVLCMLSVVPAACLGGGPLTCPTGKMEIKKKTALHSVWKSRNPSALYLETVSDGVQGGVG